MGNYVDFFRFADKWEDVFVEHDDGSTAYLYACAEPFDRAYRLACQEWRPLSDHPGEWLRYDWSGADAAYLESLEYAPEDIARQIIAMEGRNEF